MPAHFAVKVIAAEPIVNEELAAQEFADAPDPTSQPKKVFPALVGVVSKVKVDPYACVVGDGAVLPPAVS